MVTMLEAPSPKSRLADSPMLYLLEACRTSAVVWLLLVGLWSGPVPGATLAYPNGFLFVETGLAIVLFLLALRGRVLPLRTYPFLWLCLVVLSLLIMALLVRAIFGGAVFEVSMPWKYGEPMARGLLLYLAIAGHPRVTRIAVAGMLLGMLLPAGASIIQHITGVSRWYADLDGGWASGIRMIAGNRAQGLTSYVNLTAAMLAASLPFFIALPAFRLPRSRWMRAGLLLGGAMTMAALWYTNSRGPIMALVLVCCLSLIRFSLRWALGILAGVGGFLLIVLPSTPWWALVGLIVAFPLGYFIWKRGARHLLPLAAGLAMAGGLLTVDAYVLHLPLAWRVATTGLADNARLDIYAEALRIIRENPWLGIGETAVGKRVITIPALQSLPLTQRNAHNQYLQWTAAGGVPVGIGFTILALWSIVWCRRNAPAWSSSLAQALGWASAIGLATFLVANLADAFFWRIEGGGFFWSLLAVTAAAAQGGCAATKDKSCACWRELQH